MPLNNLLVCHSILSKACWLSSHSYYSIPVYIRCYIIRVSQQIARIHCGSVCGPPPRRWDGASTKSCWCFPAASICSSPTLAQSCLSLHPSLSNRPPVQPPKSPAPDRRSFLYYYPFVRMNDVASQNITVRQHNLVCMYNMSLFPEATAANLSFPPRGRMVSLKLHCSSKRACRRTWRVYCRRFFRASLALGPRTRHIHGAAACPGADDLCFWAYVTAVASRHKDVLVFRNTEENASRRSPCLSNDDFVHAVTPVYRKIRHRFHLVQDVRRADALFRASERWAVSMDSLLVARPAKNNPENVWQTSEPRD